MIGLVKLRGGERLHLAEMSSALLAEMNARLDAIAAEPDYEGAESDHVEGCLCTGEAVAS